MSATEGELFRRAFELAYFIHPNSEVALRVAEAAVCKLAHTVGKQGRRFYYAPAPDGSRPSIQITRTKVSLREEHLLQLLVYAESDSLERATEHGASPYPLIEDDLIIRFIKHLVQVTFKRNAFYVTLGLGRLLYDYETSQVRQIYDVLMQDHARFRDNSYLRKQKKLLMREIAARFAQIIKTIRTPQGEDRFQSQPTTEALLDLVRECLVRFTPWETECVLPSRFDPVARIPALYFSGAAAADESAIEMNRIHTVIDPDCFARVIASLGFPSPNERLAVPQFFYTRDEDQRGDRFNPPKLSEEDALRLQRARDESSRRRKRFQPGKLRVYVDDIECTSFDPARNAEVEFTVTPEANAIEVRGDDESRPLPLATMIVAVVIPSGGYLTDAITLEGGQQLRIELRPVGTDDENGELRVKISYRETQIARVVAALAKRTWFKLTGLAGASDEARPAYARLIIIAVAAVVVFGVLLIIWRRMKPAQSDLPTPSQVEVLPTPEIKQSPLVTPSPAGSPENPKPVIAQLVHAAWTNEPEAAATAVRLGVRRGAAPSFDIPKSHLLLIAINRAAPDGRVFRRYRIGIATDFQPIWERTLDAPKTVSDAPAYFLRLELSLEEFPKADAYKLLVEGESEGGWQSLGEIFLRPQH